MRVVPSVGGSALIEVGFNQVPASGEYRVSYSGILGAGIIEFNSAQAGVQMDVSYYGLGHINQKISLDTRVPSTGNTTIAGNKTFSGITTFSENIISEKKISTGGENSPDVDDGGICLQQNAGDGKIITFKSSDIAHGITDYAETDTYGYLQKRHAPSGGLYIVGLGEDYYGCAILGINTTVDNTETTSSHAPVNIIGAKKSGTNVSTVGADENVVTLNNLGTTRFIMKGDGELWTDYAGGLTDAVQISSYDDENDIELSRKLQTVMSGKKISKKMTNRLRELGVISNNFISIQKATRLQLGSVFQLWNMIKKIAKKLDITEEQLLQFAKNF